MHPSALRCGSLAYDEYASLADASRAGRLDGRPARRRALVARGRPAIMGVFRQVQEDRMVSATQLKRGMCIKHDHDLYRVVEALH